MTISSRIRSTSGHKLDDLEERGSSRKPRPMSADEVAARRTRIKQKIADGKMNERLWREKLSAIDAARDRADELGNSHIIACQPLQAELAELDEQRKENILRREPSDAKLDQRHAELVAELHQANAALDVKFSELDSVLKQLNSERIAAAKRVPLDVKQLEEELYNSGDPVLKARLELARHDHNSAAKRLELLRDPLLQIDAKTLRQAESEVQRLLEERYAAFNIVIDS